MTTDIATHAREPEATTAPAEPVGQTKRSRFIFAGALLIASFIAGGFLFVAGQAGVYGFLPYPIVAGLIVGVFNIGIMVYPIAQARTHKAQVKIRARVAVAAIAAGFLGTPVMMWLGQSLVGPDNGNALNYALGGLATSLNASAAFMLAYITTSKRSIIPDLETRLEVAQTTLARRHQEWIDAQAEASTLGVARDSKKSEWQSLHKAAQDAEKLVKKAQKALDKSDVSRELDEANKAHPLAEQAVANHVAEINEDKKLARAGLSEEVRRNAKARLVELNGELPNKEVAVQEALDRMKEAKKKFDASPELATRNACVEESINANKRRDAAKGELDKIEKRLQNATNTAVEKGDLHGKQSSQVTRLTDELATARRKDTNIWRDVIAGPVAALALAHLAYPGWYIWVETTIGTPNL